MSSPFSTALQERMVSDQRSFVGLAKLEIAEPSALTIYLGESEVLTPDGQLWEGGLKLDPIRQQVDSLGTGPNPASATLYLESRRYSFQSSAETVGQSLASYLWQGATVTIYLWERSLTDFADACQRFKGIVDGYALDDSRLTLNCLQDRSWNKPFPTVAIDKTNYPNAPDGQQGGVVPVVYGSHIAPPMRSPHSTSYGNKQYQEDSGGAQGAVPLVLVDPGTGSADVKLVAASHACGDLLDRANGYSLFIVGSDVLAPLDTTGLTETLGSTESSITIDDNQLVAYVGVRPIDVRTTKSPGTIVNTATNPRNAMDVFDETTYATLNQTGTLDRLVLQMPNFSSLGYIETVDAMICFSGQVGNVGNIQVKSLTTADVASTILSSAANVTTPTVATGTWAADQTWAFGSGVDLYVTFSAGTTNIAKVYWVALRVKYRPQRNMMTPEQRTIDIISGRVYTGDQRNGRVERIVVGSPGTYSLNAQFLGHLKGYMDDVGGAYTGSGSALIERPPDILRHLLTTYGSVSSFETAAGAFGSFADARDKLRNATANDFKLACWMGEPSSVQRTVQRIAEQSLLCVVQDLFTDKWLCHVWKQGDAVDYGRTLTRNDLPDLFEPSLSSTVSLVQGVRVRYGYDHFRNRTLWESYVTANGSSQGYTLPTTRDQKLTVNSTNNKLDWITSSNTTTWGAAAPYTYAETLTSADYTPMSLASHIRGKLYARMASGTRYLQVGFGFEVVAGYNDVVEFSYNASNYATTLDAGSYSAEVLAASIASKMNAAAGLAGVIGCTYSHSTNKFTFTTSAANTAFLAMGSMSQPTKDARWLFGLSVSTGSNSWTSGSPLTSTDACYADRFWVRTQTVAQLSLRFSTGTNVATCCRDLLGFATADTATGGNHVATYARGDREATCATSQSLYGPRSDSIITADWIRDEATAQQRRDREFDFGSAPRVRLTARSPFMADLQVMRVLGISSDMDQRRPFPKYGTDGSWQDKPMRVLKVIHYHAPTYHTEFEAEEA